MDKQFVNIDDLVRQRLSGKEERERSGAWANMEQLLDKEMPDKKRLAGFYWRWMFSTMAVLLLLVSISMGGYELLSSTRGNGKADVAASGTPVMKESGNNTSNTNIKTTDNQQININNPSSVAAVNHNNASTITSNKATSSSLTNTTASDKKYELTENQSNNHQNNVSDIAANNTLDTKANSTSSNTSNKQSSAVAQKHSSTATGFASVTGTKTHKPNNTNRLHSNNSTVTETKSTAITAVNTDGPVEMSSAVASNDKMAGITNSMHTHTAKPTSANYNSLAGNKRASSILTNASNAAIAKAKNAKRTTVVSELPLASSTPIATTANTNSSITSSKTTAAGTSSTSKAAHKQTSSSTLNASVTSSRLAATKSKHGASHINKPGVSSSTLAKNTTTVQAPANTAETANSEAAPEKKKIDKLVLVYRERYLKGSDDDGYFKMDTISLNAISQELAALNSNGSANKVAGSSNTPAGTAGTAAPAGSTPSSSTVAAKTPNTKVIVSASVASKSKKSGAYATNTNNTSEEEPTTEQPVPNASATEEVAAAGSDEAAVAPTGIKAKELSATKKNAGTSKTDKLVEKFNDLKYHIKGIQFAPGLIAGINGTFMAPANFKGFQFGVTGELVLNDNLSIMGELKYFNRINDNYSVEDNFYRYTPVGGQYRKELILNSYGFSTVQSIEAPVSVRYGSGKFTFFAGANFAYTFAVNTGVEGRATGNTTMTSTIETDNAPKYSTNDFNSRFGVGYLVGASYQISPNFSLDLRGVQTVWDNANTESAKSVSSQLYKHPSFQVSVGYRIGKKPSKD